MVTNPRVSNDCIVYPSWGNLHLSFLRVYTRTWPRSVLLLLYYLFIQISISWKTGRHNTWRFNGTSWGLVALYIYFHPHNPPRAPTLIFLPKCHAIVEVVGVISVVRGGGFSLSCPCFLVFRRRTKRDQDASGSGDSSSTGTIHNGAWGVAMEFLAWKWV